MKGNSFYFPNPLLGGSYQEDGLTKQFSKNILKNPKGFILSQNLQFIFLTHFPQNKNLKNKIKILAQIVAINFGLKRGLFEDLPTTKLNIIAFPIGMIYGFKIYKC